MVVGYGSGLSGVSLGSVLFMRSLAFWVESRSRYHISFFAKKIERNGEIEGEPFHVRR